MITEDDVVNHRIINLKDFHVMHIEFNGGLRDLIYDLWPHTTHMGFMRCGYNGDLFPTDFCLPLASTPKMIVDEFVSTEFKKSVKRIALRKKGKDFDYFDYC